MTTDRRPSARTAMASLTLAVAGLLLTACGGQTAGSAATFGDQRITEQQLNAEVESILTAKGQPVDSADPTLTSQTLSRMLTVALVDELATREGAAVTQGQIDEQRAAYEAQAGGPAEVERIFAEQGIAPSQITAIITLNLQAQALGPILDPHGSAEEQGQAVFAAAAALSDELDTTVSPRFGTWDATSLTVGPMADDLSSPPSLG